MHGNNIDSNYKTKDFKHLSIKYITTQNPWYDFKGLNY